MGGVRRLPLETWRASGAEAARCPVLGYFGDCGLEQEPPDLLVPFTGTYDQTETEDSRTKLEKIISSFKEHGRLGWLLTSRPKSFRISVPKNAYNLMQGVIAATMYAAIFVFSNGVAIVAGALPPSTFPTAVANRKLASLRRSRRTPRPLGRLLGRPDPIKYPVAVSEKAKTPRPKPHPTPLTPCSLPDRETGKAPKLGLRRAAPKPSSPAPASTITGSGDSLQPPPLLPPAPRRPPSSKRIQWIALLR
ncbi:hypothetical protein Taro_038437 [Colocasia esculenta]|uniref:Uncharacterized protein n=1 Tax=Colocasia esculenta TaxID=4460 RepID=A0A843WM88_COLES|nr:hypothetical protein [Colocasia esculenta]